MNVLQYLSEKNLPATTQQRGSGTYALLNCPFCEDTEKKFAIKLDTGYGSCLHENKCGWRGDWRTFQKALGDPPKRLDGGNMTIGKKEKIYKTPDVHSDRLNFLLMAYFEGRGISSDLLAHFKIGQSGKDVIMFPYFRNGKIVNVKYRSTKEKKMWTEPGGAPALFNHDNILGNMLFITEGEIDAMSMLRYGIESVSVPFGVKGLDWIEYEWEWLERFNRIYLIFDNDEAGQGAIQNIAQRLGLWRTYNVVLPLKDANECLTKGITKDQIDECINGATGFDLDSLVMPDKFEDDIIAEFENPKILYGESTGIRGLDYFIKGWRGSEVTVWSGRNSSGKTTFLNQVLIKQVQKNIPCCVASMEMPPRRLLRWWIMQMNLYTSKENIKHAITQMMNKLFIANVVGVIEPRAILDIFEYAAKKYGVKHFVIDSLMRISLDPNNELTEQKNFVSKLVSFSIDHDVHVHLVAHPRKASHDNSRPDKVDVSGSGDITNLVSNVLIMWRLDEKQKAIMESKTGKETDSVLIVKKNREWGSEGNIPLIFDLETRRYDESPEENVQTEERTDPYSD